MLRWIGIVFVIFAGCGLGYSKSMELELHLKELKELEKMFSLLRSELVHTKAPFADVFGKIEHKINSPYREWILKIRDDLNEKRSTSFLEIWNNSIGDKLKVSRLTKEEITELKEVGKQMEYPECLDIYMEQLEYHTKELREEYRTKKKIYQSMGIMGGIFLAIILL